MTDGRMLFSRNAITFDLQDTVPETPVPIQFGPTGQFGLGRFDIVKSLAVSVTGNGTKTRVVIVVVGREIV